MTRSGFWSAAIAVMALALGGCVVTHPGGVDHVRFAPDRSFVQVRTEAGVVRGVEGAGRRACLGVPYAGAPGGAPRWRAPEPGHRCGPTPR